MSKIRGKETGIEIKLRKALWAEGIRYRKNVSTIYGRPDIAIKKYKIVIFCDSEFWHGLDFEKLKISTIANKEYWINKIARNIERDTIVNTYLSENGWIVFRFWGRQIGKEVKMCVDTIVKAIEERRIKIR